MLLTIMFISFILTAVITTFSIWFYDKLLAIYISNSSVNHSILHKYTVAIPDFLLLTVCLITVSAYVVYRRRSRKGIYDKNTMFFLLIMYAVPSSFAVKTVLKFIFGRITTRAWLIKPELYGFHWFRGVGPYAGFPSGHMAVFAALAASLWRYYPRYRVIYATFLAILAAALIVTNYHFLSDVIAGAYLGVIIEVCVHKTLIRLQRFHGWYG